MLTDTVTTDPAPSFHALQPTSLPRGLREEAESMSPAVFHATYASAGGPLRLGSWQCTDPGAGPVGPQPRTYRATIAVGDRIGTSTAAASGPVAALTAMLYDLGIAVETLRFHQVPTGDDIATFIRGTDGVHDEWAMGVSADATQSALRAVMACANRLYTS